MFGFLHVPTQIYCLTGVIRARHLNYKNYDTILHTGPPSLRLHKGAGWVVGVAASWEGGREKQPFAGDTGLEPVWAFGRSTEMTSCLWPTWMV